MSRCGGSVEGGESLTSKRSWSSGQTRTPPGGRPGKGTNPARCKADSWRKRNVFTDQRKKKEKNESGVWQTYCIAYHAPQRQVLPENALDAVLKNNYWPTCSLFSIRVGWGKAFHRRPRSNRHVHVKRKSSGKSNTIPLHDSGGNICQYCQQWCVLAVMCCCCYS